MCHAICGYRTYFGCVIWEYQFLPRAGRVCFEFAKILQMFEICGKAFDEFLVDTYCISMKDGIIATICSEVVLFLEFLESIYATGYTPYLALIAFVWIPLALCKSVQFYEWQFSLCALTIEISNTDDIRLIQSFVIETTLCAALHYTVYSGLLYILKNTTPSVITERTLL